MTKSKRVKATNKEEDIKAFYSRLEKIAHFEEALSLIFWDMRTGAPKKGVAQRSKVVGTLSDEVFTMRTSPKLGELLNTLIEEDPGQQDDPILRRSLEKTKKEYDRLHKIPQDMYREYVELTTLSESVWEEAKAASDFPKFRPYLEKIVRFNIEFAKLWGYTGDRYDALLDQYEPGVTVKKIDQVFGDLRKHVVALLQEVTGSPHQPDTSFMKRPFPVSGQKAFVTYILNEMGYDFNAGRLDVTVHPVETALNPGDVRITTKYQEDDFRTSLFGTMHEGGHGLYEQNISPKLIGTPLCQGASMGIHESQSLFWENMIGRHPSFWAHYYPQLVKQFPAQLAGVGPETFYRGINVAGPSLIRIEADELTYVLHIMVRYELEKGLINAQIEVKDLPEMWNAKMKEYLGVVPTKDSEGVLQDVHWSGGSFGYFPSYALGYIYAAQFLHKMKEDLPNFAASIGAGDLSPIREWLTGHIHRYGSLEEPRDLLRRVTGEDLDARHLVAYLQEKYRDVYRLS